MENLVVNHINLTLGIAGLVSMILTGCAIQAGDALYRRFGRAQLKRQPGNSRRSLRCACQFLYSHRKWPLAKHQHGHDRKGITIKPCSC